LEVATPRELVKNILGKCLVTDLNIIRQRDFSLNLTMERGEGERALLQHRQLHRVFWLYCALLYTLLHYAYPSMPLCVSLNCSVDGVSPPSGAIRNRRSIL